MKLLGACILTALFLAGLGMEAPVTPGMQARIDEWKTKAAEWAASPDIVKAVEAENAKGPIAGMTEEKWKKTRRRDPLITAFQENQAAQVMKTKARESQGIVSEAFLSGAAGQKVAFVEKTTNYVHKGKPKFDVPFTTGKPWQGKPEFDESTQTYAIQVSVPVLSREKPIGVLVIGLSLALLQE
jgi:hypothetical protein